MDPEGAAFYQKRRDQDDDSTLNTYDVASAYDESPACDSIGLPSVRGCTYDNENGADEGTWGLALPHISEEMNHETSSGSPSLVQKDTIALKPFPYFPLLLLSNLFFILASALFSSMAYYEDYQGGRHRVTRSMNQTEKGISSLSEKEIEKPEGYHVKISTSLDTWVTKEMALILASTFLFLQSGIINMIRTWRFFHICQNLAGLFGLVSAMFWETKMIISDVFYFLFIHAMMLQGAFSLRHNYLTFIRPSMQQKSKKSRWFFALGNITAGGEAASDFYGHIHPMGNSFSVEGSLSQDGSGPPVSTIPAVQQLDEDEENEISIIREQCRYGFAFCLCDSIFVFGSILEISLTYLVIFLSVDARNEASLESSVMGDTESPILRYMATELDVVPGILWGISAFAMLCASVTYQRHAIRKPRKPSS